jgi:hypothetical protein
MHILTLFRLARSARMLPGGAFLPGYVAMYGSMETMGANKLIFIIVRCEYSDVSRPDVASWFRDLPLGFSTDDDKSRPAAAQPF